MVNKFKEILSQIELEKGLVAVFAILKMDELTDKWTIIIAAPWVTSETQKENYEYLRQLIIQKLSDEEINSISRLGTFSMNEHIVESLLVYSSDSEIHEDTKVNGNIIHEGYILKSARLDLNQ